MKWLLLTVSAIAFLTVDSRGFASGHKEHNPDNPALGPDSHRLHHKLKKILNDGLNLVNETVEMKEAPAMVQYEPRDQELPEVAQQTEKGLLNVSNFQRSDLEENKTQSKMAVRKSCVCGTVNRRRRIVNGIATEENEYPWQVAVVRRGSSSVYCGGSLINNRWVLSAAHCHITARSSQVLLGNHDTTKTESVELRCNLKRVINHPNYNEGTSPKYDNDFALLELPGPLNLEAVAPRIRPVCLPSATNPSQYEDVDVVVTGWGGLYSGGPQPEVLQEVTLRTMSNSVCSRTWGTRVTSSTICATNPGKGSCQGDSGGPVVRDVGGYFNLIGVVSTGQRGNCAHPTIPKKFARVTAAIGWITSCTSNGRTCAPPN